ncbi:hypothetical protein KKD03_02965 [Patescibacteria group bacterium]|nr:hypothetical protein [Patescibacteria group bacterium]
MNKNINKTLSEDEQTKEDMKQLAIARLRTIPSNFQISVGGDGSVSRDEAIENIMSDSKLGNELINIQLEFLRDMAGGDLYKYE